VKRMLSMLGAAALVAALAFVAPITAKPGNKYDSTTVTHECTQADGEIVYAGPLKLWPPNHKYQPVSFTANATDDSPDDTSVALDTSGTHDEIIDGEEMNGAGNTENDVNPATDAATGDGSATTDHDVRAERSGRGDGRTYTILAVATFDGEPCEGVDDEGEPIAVPFTLTVPHDMRGGADWK
jgi:hypothetical protein